MNLWCYLIMMGWVAGGVHSWKRTGIWILVLAATTLSGLATVAVVTKGSILLALPGSLLSVGMIVSAILAAGFFAWALLQSGIGDRKAKGK